MVCYFDLFLFGCVVDVFCVLGVVIDWEIFEEVGIVFIVFEVMFWCLVFVLLMDVEVELEKLVEGGMVVMVSYWVSGYEGISIFFIE